MLKKTITYLDCNEEERTEDFYFHLSDAEIAEMMLSQEGGLEQYIRRLMSTQNVPEIMDIFKKIVLKSYGRPSLDDRRFEKSKTMTEEFTQTEAYSQLFMSLAFDAKAAGEFINGIVSKKTAMKMASIENENNSQDTVANGSVTEIETQQ